MSIFIYIELGALIQAVSMILKISCNKFHNNTFIYLIIIFINLNIFSKMRYAVEDQKKYLIL